LIFYFLKLKKKGARRAFREKGIPPRRALESA